MNVTCYVVVPFDRNEHVLSGAVAFSRTGDASTGEFGDAVILAQFGEVDLEALSK
jgi:hypothetical protein